MTPKLTTRTLLALAFGAAFAFVFAAQAAEAAPKRRGHVVKRTAVKRGVQKRRSVHKRQANLNSRIQRGVRSGQLTRGEARSLRRQQGRVHAMKARALRDGKMTRREHNRVMRAQNKLSKRVYTQKHDRRRRR